MKNLTERITSATRWTVVGYGASQLLRFAGNLVLARLLIPEDFGAMALIAILMTGLVMFSDIGIGPSIIRSKLGQDPDFLNTAWTIQALRGIGLWIIACILAGPFAEFYGQPAFATLVPVASLTAMIAGFNSTALFTLNRALSLGRITGLEFISHLAGLFVMICWAWVEPTVWALVVGGLVSAFIKCTLSHFLGRETRNIFHWNKSAARELVKFGKWIFLSTAITFSANQIDRLVLGKLVSLDLLGVYSIGFMWAQMPLLLTKQWSAKVFLPAVSSLLRDEEDRTGLILAYRRNFLIIILPPTAALMVLAPSLIGLLYPVAYGQAGFVISILLIGVWLDSIAAAYGGINIASGNPQYIAFGCLVTVILFVILVFPLYEMGGIKGVALASAASRAGILVITAYGAWRVRLSHFSFDALLMLAFSMFVGAFYLIHQVMEQVWGSWIVSIAVIVAILSCVVAITFLVMRKPYKVIKK